MKGIVALCPSEAQQVQINQAKGAVTASVFSLSIIAIYEFVKKDIQNVRLSPSRGHKACRVAQAARCALKVKLLLTGLPGSLNTTSCPLIERHALAPIVATVSGLYGVLAHLRGRHRFSNTLLSSHPIRDIRYYQIRSRIGSLALRQPKHCLEAFH